jgi:alpha-ketoglutarate-dependent taurine dioxygenase
VPDEGGETEWADLRAAYDALEDAMRARVETLSAYHSLKYSQIRNGYAPGREDSQMAALMAIRQPPLRPLVKIHPETGRKSLNIGRHACSIPGMHPEDSERFLDELIAFACQLPRVWTHAWTEGDCVLWDNRCLAHRVLPWDITKPRDMRHTRLAGHPIAEFAPGAI